MTFVSVRSPFKRRFAAVALVAVVAAGAGACSDKAKVGSGVNTDIKTAIQGQRLGETTTTAAAAAPRQQVAIGATSTTIRPTTTAPPTTRPPQRVTTTTAKAQVFQVSINSDKSGKTQFDPQQVSIFVGTPIEFVNTDTVPRSVKSGQGAAQSSQSPDIPPGGTFSFTPSTAGTIPIVDGTRPYATGTLYVAAR